MRIIDKKQPSVKFSIVQAMLDNWYAYQVSSERRHDKHTLSCEPSHKPNQRGVPMSADHNTNDATGFGKFVPGFDFLQGNYHIDYTDGQYGSVVIGIQLKQ